ncbi:MAG: TonB-dependent receptor [Prolixibacteraceae bacterium]
MRKIKFILLMVAIQLFNIAQAQQKNEITGKVIDETGQGMPGVNVLVKGVKTGTVTNFEGNYVLRVDNPSTAILVFSFIGMKTKEEKVGNRKIINTILETSLNQLDEVVAVGYSNMKRRDITGSVVSVDAAEMAKTPTSDVAQALAGRVSGVMVSQAEGSPDASITIRVRGGISITGNNEPLYIIDGFPTENGLSSLDPGSIESIDILKDASSTSIYGARGANGVVVVTTKSGTPTKTTVNYDAFFGAKQLAKKLSILSPYEFVMLDYERSNLTLPAEIASFVTRYGPYSDIIKNYANRAGINWQDEAFGNTAYTQNHRFSIDGGAGKMKYNLSYSHNNDEGQMVVSGIKKNNIRLKIDHQISDKFSVSATASYTQSGVHGQGSSDGNVYFNPLSQILQYRPTIGINGKDQDLLTMNIDPLLQDVAGNVMQNPVTSAKSEDKLTETRIIQLNGGFSYKIMKGLTFKNTIGMMYQTQRNSDFFGAQSMTAIRASIQGFIKNADNQTTQTANTFTYDGSIRKNKYSLMIGQEYVTTWTRYVQASTQNFPNDDIGLNDMSLGATPGIPKSYYNNDNKLLSFFTRGYFNHADKYMVTVTMRADGSSKFGKKWGYFPSASVAWRASEEQFIKKLNIFSDLKIRLGYGDAGNNRISSYGSLALMGSVTAPFGTTTTSGYAPIQIPNKGLQWEANETMNLGLDLGFFGQRLIIAPEIYVNQSSQLLLQSTLPPSAGYTSMIQNIGKTENRGFDLTITSINLKSKNFQWSTNLNISQNKNKVVALSGEQSFLVQSGFGWDQNDHIVKVGEPIGQIFGYKVIGLYQVSDFAYNSATQAYTLNAGVPFDSRKAPQPGYWKYQDNAGALDASGNPIPDGKITDADRTVIGNATPKFYGGMNNTFTYKNFDLSVFVNFSVGNDVLNATKMYNSMTGLTNRNTLDLVNSSIRWVTVGADGNRITDPTVLNTMNSGKTVAQWANMANSDTYITSWGVEDGSFLRINNVTLGYSIPKSILKKVKLTKCRLYTTANNLYTFTKYTGFDPEVSTRNSTGLTPGVDWGAYPRSRTLTVGINLSF